MKPDSNPLKDIPNAVSALDLKDKDIPLTEDIVEGVITKGCLGIIAGQPKNGKSMLCLTVASSVANGSKVFNAYQTKQCQVLYISLEDSLRRIKRRS